MNLTQKQLAFIDEYLYDLNANPPTPKQVGHAGLTRRRPGKGRHHAPIVICPCLGLTADS